MSISDEINNASVEKLANSLVLGTNAARLVGSSPTLPTNNYESNSRFQKRVKDKS